MKKIILAIIAVVIVYQFFIKEKPSLGQEISMEQYSINEGDLVLINKEVPLKAEPTNLVAIPQMIASNLTLDSDYYAEEQVIQPLQQLLEAAQKDGVEHFTVNSAYRNGELQQQLYDKNGPAYTLPAGYSEHQSGLSLDIGSTMGMMDNVEEGRWLSEYASKFGFIIRYPADKTDVTGIGFEPWHIRYVGLPHSVKMEKENLALEEYMDYMKKKQHYKMKVDGITYSVQYIEVKDVAKIPETDEYSVSGDNMSGYIITSVLPQK